MKKSTFLFLCLEGAVLSFNVAAAAALVPSVAGTFAVSLFFAGSLIWVYMLPYGLAALLYGPLVRAYDARNVELICLFGFSAANLWAAKAHGIQALFMARFFTGVFGASVIPLALILLGRHTPSAQRGKYVGVFFGSTFVASLAGLFLSGVLHWRMIFLIPAVAGFLLWIALYFYLPSFSQDRGKFSINYFFVLKDRRVAAIFTYIFLVSLFYHGIQQWLAVYFSSKFLFGQFLISMLVALSGLSGIFGEVFGGLLSDSLGRQRTAGLGIALMAISALLFIFKSPLVILALLVIAWGMGWTFNHAGLSTMLCDLPDKFLNEAASLNSGVRFISGACGAALGGVLMQRNIDSGFIFFGSCLLILLFFGRKMVVKT